MPKMEPKVVPGHDFFDFGHSLFSCNTTRVLLDVRCFWLPQDGQKTRKTRFRKSNIKKHCPKRIFQKKTNNERWSRCGARFGPPILLQFAPEGSFFRLGAQRPQKRAQGRQKTAQGHQKEPKRKPKGNRKAPKVKKKLRVCSLQSALCSLQFAVCMQ